MHFSHASGKTGLTSNEKYNSSEKKELFQSGSLLDNSLIVTKKNEVKRPNGTQKKTLSKEEKQWNSFMRTTLLILGTFVFLSVLFLVFRMKKK
ncbi:MAG: hypothetical protein CMP63_06655 [Flavobacteriales bacterium]|nr:hypothetical protein [Flavobacteriales bacterium]